MKDKYYSQAMKNSLVIAQCVFVALIVLCLRTIETRLDGTFDISQLGRSYELYYVSVDPNNPAIETDVPCPAECKYKISGNNKHGFFITAELGWDNQDTWTSGLS